MATIYVRMIILIATLGGLLYGIFAGVWSLAIFFVMVGVYIEAVAIRDMVSTRFGLEPSRANAFDAIFGSGEKS